MVQPPTSLFLCLITHPNDAMHIIQAEKKCAFDIGRLLGTCVFYILPRNAIFLLKAQVLGELNFRHFLRFLPSLLWLDKQLILSSLFCSDWSV